jgi:hypothetical protein
MDKMAENGEKMDGFQKTIFTVLIELVPSHFYLVHAMLKARLKQGLKLPWLKRG